MITTPRTQRGRREPEPRPTARRRRAAVLVGATIAVAVPAVIAVSLIPLPGPPAAEGSPMVALGTPSATASAERSPTKTPKASPTNAKRDKLADERRDTLADQAEEIQNESERLSTTFTWPLVGSVGVPFGRRPNPITKKVTLHNGIDIRGECGRTVVAPANGRVMAIGYADDSGHYLRIDHGVFNHQAVYTTYLHLGGYLVSVGQDVTRGQPVARVGSSGQATSCHLHFSVVQNGRVVDPMGYLRG